MENFNYLKELENLNNKTKLDNIEIKEESYQDEIIETCTSKLITEENSCLNDAEEIILGGDELEPCIFDEPLTDLNHDMLEQEDLKLNFEQDQIVQDENILQHAKAYFDSIKCERKVSVYAKVNREGYITNLASDIFLKNFEGWIKIDEGDGDEYVHPQTSFFEDGLSDECGNYKHKLPNL